MLDLRRLRDNPEAVIEQLRTRNVANPPVLELVKLDDERKVILSTTEDLRATLNRESKAIGQKVKEGGKVDELKAALKEISDTISSNERKLRELEEAIEAKLLRIPNLPNENVPIGKSSEDNIVVKTATPEPLPFAPKSHLELADRLKLFDFERGTKITGSGFPLYTGMGAWLERSLWNLFLDTHRKNGYKEIIPPLLVNRETARGTGQWPNLAEDMYRVDSDVEGSEFYLIPTSEVPIANIFRGEILDGAKMPMRFAGYSPCFRREAGSYGKDTRGFLRVHQFNKIEMIWLTKPEDSYNNLETMTSHAEALLDLLEIPFRRLALCTGDMGFSAAKTYDLEVWSPFENKWLEASSCSNCEDFQARRMALRFRREQGAKPELVHILNGSGLATSRVMVALLENHQTEEGSINIPAALRPYMGHKTQITIDDIL
ncbi:MAG: serine--tRNA ligase [bacterium]|nr:serine--tRNA ligase [bacterium]